MMTLENLNLPTLQMCIREAVADYKKKDCLNPIKASCFPKDRQQITLSKLLKIRAELVVGRTGYLNESVVTVLGDLLSKLPRPKAQSILRLSDKDRILVVRTAGMSILDHFIKNIGASSPGVKIILVAHKKDAEAIRSRYSAILAKFIEYPKFEKYRGDVISSLIFTEMANIQVDA